MSTAKIRYLLDFKQQRSLLSLSGQLVQWSLCVESLQIALTQQLHKLFCRLTQQVVEEAPEPFSFHKCWAKDMDH